MDNFYDESNLDDYIREEYPEIYNYDNDYDDEYYESDYIHSIGTRIQNIIEDEYYQRTQNTERDEHLENDEYYTEAGESEQVILNLLNHRFGNSSLLDDAYRALQKVIKLKEEEYLLAAIADATESYYQEVEFQLNKRQSACPVCLDENFTTCEHFYKCLTCKSGVCPDCGPFIPNKCPMCNIRNPLKVISLEEKCQLARSQLPPKQTVRDLVYQIRYCPIKEQNVNIFGEPCNIEFNMETITHSEFDLEIAELLRLTGDKLRSLQDNMSDTEVQRYIQDEMTWALDFQHLIEV